MLCRRTGETRISVVPAQQPDKALSGTGRIHVVYVRTGPVAAAVQAGPARYKAES